MKDFIKYIKLLKYGLQFKMMMAFTGIFFGLGILFEVSGIYNDGNIGLSGLYLALSGMYVYQLVLTTSVSKFVKASPLKRGILTVGPALITTICLLFTFTTFVLLRVFYTIGLKGVGQDPDALKLAYMSIIHTAFLILFMFVYFAFSFKYYIVSTAISIIVLLPLVFVGMFSFVNEFELNLYNNITASLGEGVCRAMIFVCSYLMIFVGALLNVLINKLTYKKELSEIAYRNALRQAAKA